VRFCAPDIFFIFDTAKLASSLHPAMYRSFAAAAVAAFNGRAATQTAQLANMTWGPVTVGSMWPIYWTEGTGQPVTFSLSNATWSYNTFGKLKKLCQAHF
jgi:hypothetical protein